MRVARHKTDAAEAARNERGEEGKPGGAVLAGDDVETERLAEAVPVDADGVDDADVDRPAALPALDDQRIERQVRVGGAVERPGAELLDDRVERLRQP